MKALDENTMREASKNCWFPVHAMGYNWLKSNEKSGARIAQRVSALIKDYKKSRIQMREGYLSNPFDGRSCSSCRNPSSDRGRR